MVFVKECSALAANRAALAATSTATGSFTIGILLRHSPPECGRQAGRKTVPRLLPGC